MRNRLARLLSVCAAAAGIACSSPAASPAAVDVRNDACSHCRMTVSNPRFAAQIVSPGEEPRFFDDIGCLRAYLEAQPPLADGSAVFVASYASKSWVPAHAALYVKLDSIQTPMDSHVVAYADALEREGSPETKGGATVAAAQLFAGRLPGGAR